MNKLSIILLIVLLAASSDTMNQQKQAAKESGQTSFQPKPLDDEWNKWLVGEWKVVSGKSSVADESGTVSEIDVVEQGASGFEIEFGLNGQFLIMKSWAETGEMTDEQIQLSDEQIQYLKETSNASDEEIKRFLITPYKSLQIQTIDPKTGERIGYFFDSQRCIAKGKGRLEGNKEIMEWEWSLTGQGATSVGIIEKINDNKFSLLFIYNLPNGKKMEEKMEMIRRKE
jgi:hypothetical protein